MNAANWLLDGDSDFLAGEVTAVELGAVSMLDTVDGWESVTSDQILAVSDADPVTAPAFVIEYPDGRTVCGVSLASVRS